MYGSKKKKWTYILLILMVAVQLCFGMSGISEDNVFADKSVKNKLDTPNNIQTSASVDTISVEWEPVTKAEGNNQGELGIPENISYEIEPDKLLFYWDEVSGAESYDTELNSSITDNITVTEYIYGGIDPEAEYIFRVRSVNDTAKSGWSEEIRVKASDSLPIEEEEPLVEQDPVIGNGNGLEGEYFDNRNLKKSIFTRKDREINFDWGNGSPDPSIKKTTYSVRWAGKLLAEYTAAYTIYTYTGDGVRLWLDNELVINDWKGNSTRENIARVDLEAGEKYDITLEYYSNNKDSKAILLWSCAYKDKEVIPMQQLFCKPDTPANISTLAEGSKITVAWDNAPGAEGYEIEVDGEVIDNDMETEYVHEGLLPNTQHTYRVRAVNDVGKGDWSELKIKYTAPDVPGNIFAASTSTAITLTWDAVEAATGYDVEVLGSPVDNGNNTTYTHIDLNPNTQRIYRVRAKNENGIGDWSEIIVKSTLPGAPSNLRISSTETTIKYTWDAIAGATAYDIEVDGTMLEDILNTEYTLSDLKPNSRHDFRVRAKNDDGNGDWSEVVTGSTLPDVPTIISVESSDNSVRTVWESVYGAAEYDIEADGLIIDCGMSNEYTHNNLLPNTKHTYRVRSKSEYGIGNWTNLIGKLTLPDIPRNLAAETTSSSVKLTWNKVDGAIEYEVEADGIVINAGNDTSYVDENLTPNTEHFYRVRTRSEAGAGNWSAEIKAFTLLGMPQNIKTFSSGNSIKTVWDEVYGVTGYEIEADGSLIEIGADSEYVHTDLMPNTTHIYSVRAKAGEAAGDWSERVFATTLLASITDIKAVSTNTAITFNWTPIGEAESYDVEVDGNTAIGILEPAYKAEGLMPNTPHTFRVMAKSESNTSDWSELLTKYTTPDIPGNIMFNTTTSAIKVSWDTVNGAVGYDIEVDGVIIDNGIEISYVHEGLGPNTQHAYKLRARNEHEVSEWSVEAIGTTEPELVFNIAEDNLFNFVIAAPKVEGATERTITVTYSPEELEAVDLCAATSNKDIEVGEIHGSNLEVREFTPGNIVFSLKDPSKAIMNAIKFKAKINGQSKILYVIE